MKYCCLVWLFRWRRFKLMSLDFVHLSKSSVVWCFVSYWFSFNFYFRNVINNGIMRTIVSFQFDYWSNSLRKDKKWQSKRKKKKCNEIRLISIEMTKIKFSSWSHETLKQVKKNYVRRSKMKLKLRWEEFEKEENGKVFPRFNEIDFVNDKFRGKAQFDIHFVNGFFTV